MPMHAKSFERIAGSVPFEAGETAYRVQANVIFKMKN